jgi:hypothetical protein
MYLPASSRPGSSCSSCSLDCTAQPERCARRPARFLPRARRPVTGRGARHKRADLARARRGVGCQVLPRARKRAHTRVAAQAHDRRPHAVRRALRRAAVRLPRCYDTCTRWGSDGVPAPRSSPRRRSNTCTTRSRGAAATPIAGFNGRDCAHVADHTVGRRTRASVAAAHPRLSW